MKIWVTPKIITIKYDYLQNYIKSAACSGDFGDARIGKRQR